MKALHRFTEGTASPPRDDPSTTAPEAPEELERRIVFLDAASRSCSRLRLGSFLVFLAGLFATDASLLFPLLLSAPALLVFAIVFRRHGGVKAERERCAHRLLLLRESEERRTTRRRARPLPPLMPEKGLRLERGARIYAPEPESFPLDEGVIEDLSVLRGPRSLFGLLDVSSTIFGARRLEYLLTHPLARTEDIRTRQRAVAALAETDHLRREVLEALLSLRHRPLERIPGFLETPSALADRRWVGTASAVLGTLCPLLLILTFVRMEVFLPLFFFSVVANLALIGSFVKASNPARDRLLAFSPLLGGLLRVEESLERAAIDDPSWNRIGKLLSSLRSPLRALQRKIRLLELHSYGVIFEILNVLTLWELRLLPGAERLFDRHRESLERALGALGETEALLSLACLQSEQRGFCVPDARDDEFPLVEAEAMGHPLLEEKGLVRNPLSLSADANVMIITGSNMSGKSTYLKSAGTNIVLAGAGAAVCARKLSWTPLRVLSDINVRDSLDDGKSYFQVEVERVLEVVRAAGSSRKVLAIFDELFRGTNSEERLAIARSLLRHLRDRGILLLVATHDVALTRLVVAEREPGMRNLHFREEVAGSEMSFDYRLREGPSPTRNATRVLEASGYPREITRAARRELEER